MTNIAMENASEVAVNLAHLTNELGKAKVLVDEAIETGKHKAERLAKQANNAVQDCVEDTTYYIKRHPWQAVGVAACVGTAAGLLLSLAFIPFRNRAK